MLNILNLKRKAFLSLYLKNINLIKILFVIFMVGMIYGAMLIGLNRDEAVNQLGSIMQKFINKRIEQSIFITFASSFFSSMILVVILFLVGFFSIGQPIAFFIPMFQGMGIGLSTAYLYSSKGISGIIFCLILIAPTTIISTITLLLGSKESIRFSNKNLRTLFPQKFDQNMQGELNLYLKRFSALTIFQLVSAVVDTMCTFLFARFLG